MGYAFSLETQEANVYQLLSNHTGKGSGRASELIVVGSFDTTCKDCQVQYCSVGKWSGYEFARVGEGLCNSALSLGMKITAGSLAR